MDTGKCCQSFICPAVFVFIFVFTCVNVMMKKLQEDSEGAFLKIMNYMNSQNIKVIWDAGP